MNPIFFIVIVVALGILLVPVLWTVVVRLLRLLSPRLKASAFIAAGHLRGRRKKGFVSVIGIVSIYAICASSCHVTTVLSVMGGFGDDLKKKILGAKAHIIIDSPGGLVKDEQDIMKMLGGMPEVIGAYPYLEEELMVRSSLNISGAVMRGINVWQAVKVTNLKDTVEEGKLEYLGHPEKILTEVYKQPTSLLSPTEAIKESLEKVEKAEKEKQRHGPGRDGRLEERERGIERPDEEIGPGPGELQANKPKPPVDSGVLPAVVVGREMSKNLGIFVGDDVKLISPLGDIGPTGPIPKIRMFRTGAVFFSGMYEYDAKNIYVSLEAARSFLGVPEGVTGIEVKIRKPQSAEKVTALIVKKLKAKHYNLRVRHWKELNRSLFSALLLEKIGMFLMLSLTILIASFSIISTLIMVVMEKTQDIAVLKTVGASDGTIMRIFHFEGFLLGVVGTVIGISLGILLCWFIHHFGIPINPEVHYIDKLPVKMEPAEITLVAAASLLICLLITLYPARLASRQGILEGLRNR
jgi:lipoprotein-releasing system permease protein